MGSAPPAARLAATVVDGLGVVHIGRAGWLACREGRLFGARAGSAAGKARCVHLWNAPSGWEECALSCLPRAMPWAPTDVPRWGGRPEGGEAGYAVGLAGWSGEVFMVLVRRRELGVGSATGGGGPVGACFLNALRQAWRSFYNDSES